MSAYTLTPMKYLVETEQAHLEALLAVHRFTDARNTTMLFMMLKTGARPQELLNLTWADIDWNAKTVFIKTIKGGRPRLIPMVPILCERLREWTWIDAKPDERLFKIEYATFRRIWDTYRPCAKKLHSLRHTFAVNMYRRCKSLELVQQALGHESLQTTSIYLQIASSMDDMRAAIE